MSSQSEFSFDQPGTDADFLRSLLERADQVLVKKLSNNDRNWAKQKEDEEGRPIPGKRLNNQAGVYIPKEQRDSGFFPALAAKQREEGSGDEIREMFFETVWPQFEEKPRRSRLVNYTSKGEETHLTRIPRPGFIYLLHASLMLMVSIRGGS